MTHEELFRKKWIVFLKRLHQQAFRDLMLTGQTRPLGEYLSEEDKNKLKELNLENSYDPNLPRLPYRPD